MGIHSNRQRRWRRWYRRIEKELIKLRTRRYVFERVGQIVRTNPQVNQRNEFHDLIISGYFTDLSMGMRRLCEQQSDDPKRRVVSLRALLEEITDNPRALTRRRIRNWRSQASEQPLDAHDRLVTERDLGSMPWMGPTHVNPSRVQEDIDRLEATYKPVQTFINKTLAHNDWRNLPRIRSIRKLHKLVDCVESIASTCKLHLEDGMIVGPESPYTAHILSDWEDVLRVPWLPCDEDE